MNSFWGLVVTPRLGWSGRAWQPQMAVVSLTLSNGHCALLSAARLLWRKWGCALMPLAGEEHFLTCNSLYEYELMHSPISPLQWSCVLMPLPHNLPHNPEAEFQQWPCVLSLEWQWGTSTRLSPMLMLMNWPRATTADCKATTQTTCMCGT